MEVMPILFRLVVIIVFKKKNKAFIFYQYLWSYQDVYWLGTLCTPGTYLRQPHWEIRPVAPWHKYPTLGNYPKTELTSPFPILSIQSIWLVKQASHCPEIGPWWTHEWICPFGSSFRNLLACQRFREHSQSWYQWWRNTTNVHVHTMAYHTLTNGPMFFTITSEFQESVRPTVRSPTNLKINSAGIWNCQPSSIWEACALTDSANTSGLCS